MLSNLYISGFKCFDTLDLDLGPLTLLAGVNGGGKSTVIQALVLLAQTFELREWGRRLLLDGPELALGSVADVLSQYTGRRQLVLGVNAGAERVVWTFRAEDRRALAIDLAAVAIDGQDVPLGDAVRWLLPAPHAARSIAVGALRRLSWITAERSGPRELLPLKDADGHTRVGHRGELAAGLLYWRESDGVIPALCVPDTPQTLFHQVRAHMQQIFPGCDLRISTIERASVVSLHFRSDSRADFQRPQNVGFGLTQIFPIVVALLAAREGDLLLIENPEVHLHPGAQQHIGVLAARTAAFGVQVIMETHSDHVLNGVRLAVKRGLVPAQDVAVHFFGHTPPGQAVVPISPRIDADGRLDIWPDGFFDQLDFALSELL